jgi:hypothetical protein
VSVVRDGNVSDARLLSGPYALHASALAAVPEATRVASDFDPKAWFYAFGTVRMAASYSEPGILNRLGKMEVKEVDSA